MNLDLSSSSTRTLKNTNPDLNKRTHAQIFQHFLALSCQPNTKIKTQTDFQQEHKHKPSHRSSLSTKHKNKPKHQQEYKHKPSNRSFLSTKHKNNKHKPNHQQEYKHKPNNPSSENP